MTAKDELIKSVSLQNAELIATSVRTRLRHAPSSAQSSFLRSPAVAILRGLMW